MPGPRQPIDVLVAKGRKHLTKAEIAERRESEPKVDEPVVDKPERPETKKIKNTATPPKWLPEQLKKDFRALGKQLIAAGLYTRLDADTLGRYLVAQHQWLIATQQAEAALAAKPPDLEQADAWGRVQERYFKQARNSATDMGLTVTSRCRLVVPENTKQKTEADNPFLRLIQGGRENSA